MIALDPITAFFVAMLLMAWMILAVWLTVRAARQLRRAKDNAAELSRLRRMLDTGPATVLVLGPSGQLSGSARFTQWLGLDRAPATLGECQRGLYGLTDGSLEELTREAVAAQRSGRSFSISLSVQGTDRVIRMEGAPAAPGQGGPGTLVLWCFDDTAQHAARGWLQRESRERAEALDALSSLVEAAPFPIWHRDDRLKLRLVNTAYVRAVEARDASEVIAREIELVDRASRSDPLRVAREAQALNAIQHQDVAATIGGQRRSLRIAHVPLGPAGVAGFALDTTDLDAAKADLARFAGAQRAMLDRLSAGVAQFGPDHTLRFTNQPMQRMFDLETEWLAERPFFDRVLERMRDGNRVPQVRDFPAWKAEKRAWFQMTGSVAEESWLLPDGTHFRVVAQPLPDAGLLLIFEDRTEQAQLASARDTLLRVRTATFDNLFESVGVFAADGRLQLWNNRFREAWEIEEDDLADHPRVDHLAKRLAPKLADPKQIDGWRDMIRAALSDRRHRSGRLALANGRYFECAAVPLPDGNALFALLDVTASRQAEAALRERADVLEEADRIKNAFMSNISYDLRTPLTSISGFAEMLAGGFAGPLPEAANDYVAAIVQASDRLGALIDDLLDLTQGEAGSLPLSIADVQIAGVIGEVVGQHRATAERHHQDFAVEIAASAGSVKGDSRRIRQCVDHLLRNAMQYTPERGRILLHADGDATAARIVVSDNGRGIAPADQNRVFGGFTRASEGRADRSDGAGIGLPLVRRYVEAHGGQLDLVSEPGEGTCVTITLPRAGPAA